MNGKIKSTLRRAAAIALYYSGALWLLARFLLRGKIAVLMYHRVLPESSDSFSAAGVRVTPATFDRHIRFLKRFFNLLTPNELEQVLTGARPVPPRACAVTFDDGWFDNYTYALPILERHAVPAIVFLATDYVGSDHCFWQEKLTRLLYLARRRNADALFRDLGAADIPHLPDAQARHAIRILVTSLKSKPRAEIDRLVERAGALLPADANASGGGDDRFMSWSDAAALPRSGLVHLGSHAQSHTPLPRLTPTQLLTEIRESRSQIEANTQQPVDAFAYPNGDYSPQVVEAIRSAGYRLAFTTESRLAGPGDDPMRVPRLNIHERDAATDAEFLSRILRLP